VTSSQDKSSSNDRYSIANELTKADDRIRLSHWLPAKYGIIPHIRVGRRWFNVLWLLPISAFLLLVVIAAAQSLRELPSVQAFINLYPGVSRSAPAVGTGFPWWLRLQHFLNMFFMFFIIRAGIQILADHPRLYWRRDSTPGTEWFRFQTEVPEDRIWTAKDDSVTLPQWLGIPGLRHSIGLARWWHFSADLLWTLNGVVFYVLLFATNQWLRIVPLSWDVFPNSVSTAIQYASLNFPVEDAWTRFNALQQLTYFITLFVAAPISLITGLLQGPAISNRLGWLGRLVNRQMARSIHFISFTWFVLFILAHGALVFMTGLRENTSYMFAGTRDHSWSGFFVFLIAMGVIVVCWCWASPFTIRHARVVQRTGRFMVGWLKGLTEWFDPQSQLTEKDISPHFWPNGTMPASAEFEALVAGDFMDYRLRIGGLVETPRQFSLAELKGIAANLISWCHFTRVDAVGNAYLGN
jgi:methionine sulfoxide reductase catalytic subunit